MTTIISVPTSVNDESQRFEKDRLEMLDHSAYMSIEVTLPKIEETPRLKRLRELGLLGAIEDSDVTSTNYKNYLYAQDSHLSS